VPADRRHLAVLRISVYYDRSVALAVVKSTNVINETEGRHRE
jgi:hypothetical protein